MKKMCVIGSLNVDLVTSMDRFPRVGETIFTNTFEIFTGGGKGANQAFALGRLGADVRMVGKTGDTFYGPEYVRVLEENNIKCDTIAIEKNTFPGAAVVAVDGNGDNLLFVYPGANALVDIPFVEANWQKISACDIFLFQQEIPPETNTYLMKRLKELNKVLVFDPAPARAFSQELYNYVDYITPNESELETLSGMKVAEEKDFIVAARILIDRGAKTVIAKAGKNGAYVVDRDSYTHVKGYKVKTVDPTAAGDSFNAGFAFALGQGRDVLDSVRFANAVAGLSTTAMGAQSAMPTLEEVTGFIGSQAE